jgi:acetoin utilization deacetylase AcuC-like enzyme/GNAT superfamily N-acetyltransferase
MFRVRRIFDDALPVNRSAIEQIEAILRDQFPGLSEREVAAALARIKNHGSDAFRPLVYVGENRNQVRGFALVLLARKQHFGLLDFLAARSGGTGGGVGGALYDRVREEVSDLGCRAIFLECHGDDPRPGLSEQIRRQNAARLRFYERYGARPIEGSDYERPVDPTSSSPGPRLVLDPLGGPLPGRRFVRTAVRTILEQKYGWLCPPEYIDAVVASFRDDPVRLRAPSARRPAAVITPAGAAAHATPTPPRHPLIPLVVNDRHQIHHVRERGYVESPVRIPRILASLEPSGLFRQVEPRERGIRHVTAVHDPRLVRYLETASAEMPEGRTLYPYVFPIRNPDRPPRERSVLAGYYCIDTFTPIHRNSFLAAKRAVDCTLAAADALLDGERLAYSLVRPPGHHAERRCFGGFCYFNNAAIAAHYLSRLGRVAILDIDYHHGNGQQDIFYRRADVLTVSLHGHPRFAYPYFSGFEEERGEDEGTGFNRNFALPESVDGEGYTRALRRALRTVEDFAPLFLLVAFGLDTAKGDPTGTWSLGAADLRSNGALIGALGLSTLVVQEGGYRTRTLGSNALAFFEGLVSRAPRN